ncbi:hypothetical protein GQ54DRAFT_30123 [Martensiomyces pterosporus]|nr:hypothetical protein GQ54DRAFT_30123 [Martensiomyces pterosporus]
MPLLECILYPMGNPTARQQQDAASVCAATADLGMWVVATTALPAQRKGAGCLYDAFAHAVLCAPGSCVSTSASCSPDEQPQRHLHDGATFCGAWFRMAAIAAGGWWSSGSGCHTAGKRLGARSPSASASFMLLRTGPGWVCACVHPLTCWCLPQDTSSRERVARQSTTLASI